MPIILSHRGNLVGPCASAENRLTTVRAALDCGWGVETDIRCAADGRFYISHDVRPSAHETPAEDFRCSGLSARPSPGTSGGEEALIRLLTRDVWPDLLSTWNCSSTGSALARTFKNSTRDQIAAVSAIWRINRTGAQRQVASEIWLDEFDGPHRADIRRLKRPVDHSTQFRGSSRKPAERLCCWLDYLGVDGTLHFTRPRTCVQGLRARGCRMIVGRWKR